MRNVVVAVCFFLSGGSGLVFETLWTRKLTHVFGSTTLSVASVLTAFMGGLALGSWLLGRHLADRVRRPILWYAALEGVVGAWGLLVPVVVEHVYPQLNRFLWSNFEPGYFAFSFLRFLFVLVLLLPPTTLMGATLPLLARHFVATEAEARRVGSRVGALYALNTAGAILGTFAAAFLLLPAVGFAWTNGLASATNLALCAAVLAAFLALRAPPAPGPAVAAPPAGAPEPVDDEEAYVLGRRARRAALVAFGVSGFAAMNYQVAWNRLLSMVIGASVYSFAVILLAFLVGIAAGSALASAVLRRLRNPVLWLGLVQLWIGVSGAATYYLADDYPHLFAWLVDRSGAVSSSGAAAGVVMLAAFLVAALAVLPATLGMGATLPLTVRICAAGRERVGRDVGTIYAVNTLGAILGSFASAFVLVPGLSRLSAAVFGHGYGLQLTLAASILLNLGLALALFLLAPDRKRGREEREVRVVVFRWTAVPLVVGLVALLLGLTALHRWTWNIDRLVAGSFRLAYLSSILKGERRGELLYLADGISTTVTVQRWGSHLALKNNGKVDASNGDDMPTQVMVAGLPLLLHPRGPRDLQVAVVGFGSGVTVGTALGLPVRRVDVVELEPAVVESSYYFRNENLLDYGDDKGKPPAPRPRPLRPDPRLRVLSNDGRNFLASTAERYDVVVSEPSNPWITGVSNLFTLDHFLAARQALAPDGVFCQWVQLYEMSPESVKSIFRTFAAAFPYVIVASASPGSSDTILLGSRRPLALRVRPIRLLLADEDVGRVLAESRSDIASADDIPARLLFADRDEVLAYTRGATINTDDNAFVEFRAPRDMIRYARLDSDVVAEVYAPSWNWGRPDLARLRAAGYAVDGPDAVRELHGVVEALVRAGRLWWAARLVREALASPQVPFAPDAETADDMRRVLRAARDPSAPAPALGDFDLLRAALREAPADPALAADADEARRLYAGPPPRPAAAAWLLAGAAARARARGVAPSPRLAFLLDAVRGSLEDEAVLAGVPIAERLPAEWQPLAASAVERGLAAALRAAAASERAALAAVPGPGGRRAVDVASGWAGAQLRRRVRGETVPPDADAHGARLLLQSAVVSGRAVRPGESAAATEAARRAARDWQKGLEAVFDSWAVEEFTRVLPELTLFDAAVAAAEDPWSAADRLWAYVRVAGVRRELLERGDAWMEAHGVPLPAPSAVAEALGPAAASYAEFVHALDAGDPDAAVAIWDRAVDVALAAGLDRAFVEVVPRPAAELAVAAVRLRRGEAAKAWEVLARLLGDAALRRARPDVAYWAARALHLRRLGARPAEIAGAGEHELRGDLLLAAQLMDRWVRAGAEAGQRILVDGVPVLEASPGGRAPYLPLVSEQLVRGWFDDTELAGSFDATGIAAAFVRDDWTRVDAAVAAASDAALRQPDPGSWGGTMADDGALGGFAELPGGVDALVLFEALRGALVDERSAEEAAVRAALDRFAVSGLPARLAALRAAVAFRFLEASFRCGRGERGAMLMLLGEALPDGPPPGSPLARLLAVSPPARYHLARLVARCGLGGCAFPAAPELARALALAATVAGGSELYLWQADYRDPYRRVQTPTADLGTYVFKGAP